MDYKTLITTVGVIVLFNVISGRWGDWIKNNELVALGIAVGLIWWGSKR